MTKYVQGDRNHCVKDLILRVGTLGWDKGNDSKKSQKTELMTELKNEDIWRGQRGVHYRLV